MTQIYVHNRLGSPVVVELRQNDFVDLWILKLRHCIQQRYKIVSKILEVPTPTLPWYDHAVRPLIANIKHAIQRLNDLNLGFPVNLRQVKFANDNATRALLNRLHRCFTTGNHTRRHWEYDQSGRPLQTYIVNSSIVKEFTHWVHEINNNVHALEVYMTSDRDKDIPRCREYHVMFDNHHEHNGPWRRYLPVGKEYDWYRDDGGPWDVWLPLSQIQGKDMLRAYLDHDDPHAWDVCSGEYYSGDFVFTDMSYYRHPVLRDWLITQKVPVDGRCLAMPLGLVVTNKHLVQQLRSGDVMQVEVR